MALQNYSSQIQAAQVNAASTLDVQPKKTPELQMLGADLHGIASNLGVTADRLESKLAWFLNEGQEISGDANKTPEPVPGTLASLTLAQNRLRVQQERIALLVGRLLDII